MTRIGSDRMQTAVPTPGVAQKPAAASEATTAKAPKNADVFERQAKGGERFQLGGASKPEAVVLRNSPLKHAVSNLGQTLGRLDTKLGKTGEGSLSHTLQTLWTEAHVQKADAGLTAKAMALATIAEINRATNL